MRQVDLSFVGVKQDVPQKHHGSVFEDEGELLQALIDIHSPDGIDLDPMYFKGNFYKTVQSPRWKFDISPQSSNVKYADARELPFEDRAISSMILDPPFMIATRKSQREYYSSGTHGYYNSLEELQKSYSDLIQEALRVLKVGGVLYFKCQDYTDSKTLMIHCMVYNIATSLGFYAKDMAILNKPKNKVSNHKLTQRHLRKVHTYFWVFTKIHNAQIPPQSLTSGQQDLTKSQMPDGTSADRNPVFNKGISRGE